jgi:hypothetical protein
VHDKLHQLLLPSQLSESNSNNHSKQASKQCRPIHRRDQTLQWDHHNQSARTALTEVAQTSLLDHK